jgi:hypothetical protein
MGRPRKNPNDPKWVEPQGSTDNVNDDWRLFFAAALGGLIARGGGMSFDQIIKTASQLATEAQTAINSPLK